MPGEPRGYPPHRSVDRPSAIGRALCILPFGGFLNGILNAERKGTFVSQVYVTGQDSATTPLQRVSCENEDKELQRLLERNLDLIPGDQISSGETLRWMLVKREMPVVNPASGDAAWSIDFLLADQYGVPTLVECKRRNDSRSPRETVGQMLEYAASGKNYWTASDFRSHAQDTAKGEVGLTAALKELTGTDTDPDQFFSSMEKNLNESKLRLIFFVDDSRLELRSLVEFLNGQFKDLEILIVEARQYQQDNSRIVVPWVFGFTEAARVAKRESKAETLRASGPTGEDAFWEVISKDSSLQGSLDELRNFIKDVAAIPGSEVDWWKSCIVRFPKIVPARTLFTITREGWIQLYLVNWERSGTPVLTEAQAAARDKFFRGVEKTFEMDTIDPQIKQYPLISPKKWLPRAADFLTLIRQIAELKWTATLQAGPDTEM